MVDCENIEDNIEKVFDFFYTNTGIGPNDGDDKIIKNLKDNFESMKNLITDEKKFQEIKSELSGNKESYKKYFEIFLKTTDPTTILALHSHNIENLEGLLLNNQNGGEGNEFIQPEGLIDDDGVVVAKGDQVDKFKYSVVIGTFGTTLISISLGAAGLGPAGVAIGIIVGAGLVIYSSMLHEENYNEFRKLYARANLNVGDKVSYKVKGKKKFGKIIKKNEDITYNITSYEEGQNTEEEPKLPTEENVPAKSIMRNWKYEDGEVIYEEISVYKRPPNGLIRGVLRTITNVTGIRTFFSNMKESVRNIPSAMKNFRSPTVASTSKENHQSGGETDNKLCDDIKNFMKKNHIEENIGEKIIKNLEEFKNPTEETKHKNEFERLTAKLREQTTQVSNLTEKAEEERKKAQVHLKQGGRHMRKLKGKSLKKRGGRKSIKKCVKKVVKKGGRKSVRKSLNKRRRKSVRR